MCLRRHCWSLLLLLSSFAHAATPSVERAHAPSPFERRFGLGAYATGWAGTYGAAGVGGRVRVELTRWLGTDLFGEALVVSGAGGLRHDHPIGFNLFLPLTFGRVRLRPLAGMCVTFSFIEPLEPGAPRADDVLFGVHLGAGLELALHQRLSFFIEGKGVAWLGHDRFVGGWTGSVDNDVSLFPVAQAQLGLTFHL